MKIIVTLLLLLLPSFSFTAEINPATCSSTDVRAALASASIGDTINVPAGTCDWGTITQDEGTIHITLDGIKLIGAGIDSTTINDTTESGQAENPVHILADDVRVSGFTFTGMDRTTFTEPAIGGSGLGFRIDNNKFEPDTNVDVWQNGRGIYIGGTGVIDNNTFIDTYQGIGVQKNSVGGDSGDDIWTGSLTLGTADAIYIEDNEFDYTSSAIDGAFDAYDGAKVVFRHNTVTNTTYGVHGFDTGGLRSTFSYEIYENTFSRTATGDIALTNLRGGTGVIYNNTVTGNYRAGNLANYRTCTDYSGDSGPDLCDGDSIYDGNTAPTGTNYGWPCQDQIGRTANQASYPLYLWGNTLDGGAYTIGINDFCEGGIMGTAHLVDGRDYYSNTENTGYTPYTYPHPLQTREKTQLSTGTQTTISTGTQTSIQ